MSDVTVREMVRSLRAENDRLHEQIRNLIQCSTYEELFTPGPICERGRELAQKLAENTKVLEAAEQFLSRPEKRELEQEPFPFPELLYLPLSENQFLKDVQGSTSVPLFRDGSRVGTLFEHPKHSSNMLLHSREAIDKLLQIGFVTTTFGGGENDTC